ncbi:MAG: DNA-binding MarR family transcriptional regulator [Gammaproteobacteria bacterium]
MSAKKVGGIRQSPTGRGKQSLRLWLRLLACENLVEQHVRAQLRTRFDITLPQFDVLAELENAGEALTMSQLSDKLMVSNGNVTGVVDRLERDGHVRREPSATDRRVQFIALTDRGIESFREMADAHEHWITKLFGQLKPTDIKSLLEGLEHAKISISANL